MKNDKSRSESKTQTDPSAIIREQGQKALSLGLSVLPIKTDGSKVTTLKSWKQFQTRLGTSEELEGWFSGDFGLGIVTGSVSGNLECLDFDDPEIFQSFCKRAEEWGLRSLLDKVKNGYHERTPNGHHLLYRCCNGPEKSQKLARREKSPEEASGSNPESKVLIETRGEGAYFIAAPSCGEVHESGKPYVLMSGSLDSIVTISPDEREDLLSLARSFDEIRDPAEPAKTGKSQNDRPGDDFASKTSWPEILEPHGWKSANSSREVDYWTRPGKDKGVSASTNYNGNDCLHVFSSSTPFNADRSYSKFTAYAILNHQSNFKAAARQLAEEGFGSEESKPTRPNLAGRLLKLAEKSTVFHSEDEEPYAIVKVDGEGSPHFETWPIRSLGFKRWLLHQFYLEERTAPDGKALKEAVRTLESRAVFTGDEIPVFRRVARLNGCVYLDLCDPIWRMVRITPMGWKIISGADAPVRFYRTSAMRALPVPERGAPIDDLRAFLNLSSNTDDDWILLLTWATSVLAAIAPYALLMLTGEQGSAKSTNARILRSLLDPNAAPLRSPPRSNRDLLVTAKQSGLVALDNLSKIPQWLSDSLCCLCTGGGIAGRGLYTNDEEHVISARVPVLVTAIGHVITSSDLIDRSIIVELPRITNNERRNENEMMRSFEDASPQLMGALLDAVVIGLRELPSVQMISSPRMADFARWGVALEKGLSWNNGEFLIAYSSNRKEASNLPIEATAIGQALFDFAHAGGCRRITWAELLKKLDKCGSEEAQREREWPKSPRALSDRVRKLAPHLRNLEIEVDWNKTSGKRWITISPPPNQTQTTVTTVPPVPAKEKNAIFAKTYGYAEGDVDRDDYDSEGGDADNDGPSATSCISLEIADRDGRDGVAGESGEGLETGSLLPVPPGFEEMGR